MISTNSSELLGRFLTHSEKPRWSCARRPFGTCPYATSRMRMCLNSYSSSSCTFDVGGARRSHDAPGPRGPVADPRVVCRPTHRGAQARLPRTRRRRRRRGGQAASPSFETVETRADQRLDIRRDRNVAHLVSLPAREIEQSLVAEHPYRLLEEERVSARVGDQRRAERRLGEARHCRSDRSAARSASSGPSVCRWTVRRRPSEPRKPGASSLSSGRAVADERERHAGLVGERRSESSSRSVGSAQCRSSTTTAVGFLVARSCSARRMPQWSSACEISLVAYVPRGVVGIPIRFESAEAIVRSSSRSWVASVSRKASSRAALVSRSSLCMIPAADLKISTIGQ